MSRRIEVNLILSPVAFPRPLLSEICAHARETLPEECCGLVFGNARDRYHRVARCRNDSTQHHLRDPQRFPRDGRHGFHMNELDYLHAVESAEALGEQVTVVYHSHVDCGPYFSALDLHYARQDEFPFPDAEHLVVSVIQGRVDGVALFQAEGPEGAFVGRSVVPATP